MKDQKQKNVKRHGKTPSFDLFNKPQKAKSPDIRTVLLRYITVFFALMLALLWILLALFSDVMYREIKEHEIREAYRKLSTLDIGNDISNDVRVIAEKYDVCLSIYKVSDSVRAETVTDVHTLSHCTVHNTDSNAKFRLYEAAKGNNGAFFRYFTYDRENSVFSAIPKKDASKETGEISLLYVRVSSGTNAGEDILVILNSVITPVSATVNTIYLLLAIFTVSFILMSILFTWLLSRKFTAPLTQLTENAKGFAELVSNNSPTPINVSGYREIEQLSDTLEYALSELNKNECLRRELIANFSHDLRTPLTMMIGYGEMMRDIPGENTSENADNIVKEAERLNQLVNDMLELSRLQTGTAEIKPEIFRLDKLVETETARYRELTAHDGYTVTFDSNGAVFVNSDVKKIERVLQNLIGNAIRHTGENKQISVSVIAQNGWTTVEVKDAGNGIPPDQLSQIWERYYKINSAHSRGSGTGLGLSIVKATMEQLEGHYGVESKLGSGSVFWFAIRSTDIPQ